MLTTFKKAFLATRTVMCAALLGAIGSLSGPIVVAQENGVIPPQLFNNSRRLQGDTIRYCVDEFSVGAKFDRAVASAISDALLVKAEFVPAPSGFPMDGGGYLEELQLVMSNECEVLVGISMTPGAAESPWPDWATVTRPYAQVPFVVAVTDANYKSLADIPPGKTLGAMVGSLALGSVVTWNQQNPPEKRFRYLPYGDPNLLLKRLLDGTLSAMVLWQPQLAQLMRANPTATNVKTASFAPLKTVVNGVGNLVSSRDSFLRASIDQAIGQLVSDGTIARLMKENGYEGTPGP